MSAQQVFLDWIAKNVPTQLQTQPLIAFAAEFGQIFSGVSSIVKKMTSSIEYEFKFNARCISASQSIDLILAWKLISIVSVDIGHTIISIDPITMKINVKSFIDLDCSTPHVSIYELYETKINLNKVTDFIENTVAQILVAIIPAPNMNSASSIMDMGSIPALGLFSASKPHSSTNFIDPFSSFIPQIPNMIPSQQKMQLAPKVNTQQPIQQNKVVQVSQTPQIEKVISLSSFALPLENQTTQPQSQQMIQQPQSAIHSSPQQITSAKLDTMAPPSSGSQKQMLDDNAPKAPKLPDTPALPTKLAMPQSMKKVQLTPNRTRGSHIPPNADKNK